MYINDKVNSILRQLYSGLKPLFPQDSLEVILFGSYARDEAEDDSDIDVMILVDSSRQEISKKTWEVGEVVADILIKHGVVISPILENRSYYLENINFLPLFRNIAQEGIRYIS